MTLMTEGSGASKLPALWAEWAEHAGARRLAIIAFIFGAIVMLMYRPWRQIDVAVLECKDEAKENL